MVSGEMFLRPLFVIAASPSRFPQDMPAERVILAPVAFGCDFHQFVVHSPTIALTDMGPSQVSRFLQGHRGRRNSHLLHAEVRCERPLPSADGNRWRAPPPMPATAVQGLSRAYPARRTNAAAAGLPPDELAS